MVKCTYFRDMSLDEIQVASIFFATKYVLTPHSDQKYVICHQFTVKTCPHPFLCSSLCGSNVTFSLLKANAYISSIYRITYRGQNIIHCIYSF